MLMCAAAPFSIGGERPLSTASAESDLRIDLGEPAGQPHHDATGSEPQAAEADAQECALLVDAAWTNACAMTAAVDRVHLPVTNPLLAKLERPPRGR